MDIYTLTNGNGLTARITDFGARIVSLLVPNRNGNLCDIVLGFDNLDDYLPQNHLSDFGALIGRYARWPYRLAVCPFPVGGMFRAFANPSAP